MREEPHPYVGSVGGVVRNKLEAKMPRNTILAELRRRDRLDSERKLAPLQPAPDAKVIDTDGLNIEQVLAEIMGIIGGC